MMCVMTDDQANVVQWRPCFGCCIGFQMQSEAGVAGARHDAL